MASNDAHFNAGDENFYGRYPAHGEAC